MSDSEYSSSDDGGAPMAAPPPRARPSTGPPPPGVARYPPGYSYATPQASYKAPKIPSAPKKSKKSKGAPPVATRLVASGRPWDAYESQRYEPPPRYAPPPYNYGRGWVPEHPPGWVYAPYPPPAAKKAVVKRKQSPHMAARADMVRKVMTEHGLSLGEASKYVKDHNLWSK